MKQAVEAQLEPGVPPPERRQRLEKLIRKFEYQNRRRRVASRCHDRTTRRKLQDAGIDLRHAIRCPQWK